MDDAKASDREERDESQAERRAEPKAGRIPILIADDDPISLRLLEASLGRWGHSVIAAHDGVEAWTILKAQTGPMLAILDWMMPGLDGPEICRRALGWKSRLYLILLTARGRGEDLVRGLESGADDYLTKPFDKEELRARVQSGIRVIELQSRLAERVGQLEEALARVTQLQGLLPICMYCKRIRNDQNYWQQVESFVAEHSAAEFSHGVCPECFTKFVEPQLKK